MQSPQINPLELSLEEANALFEKNLNDAIRIAKSYARKNRELEVDELDLVNHAIIGLITAINRFDPRLARKFRSYARIRIRGAVLDRLRAIDPLSRSERRLLISIRKAEKRLNKLLARRPTLEELAIELSVPPEKIVSLKKHIEPSVISLQQKDLVAGKVHDIIDFEGSDPLGLLMNYQNIELLKKGMEQLTEKQRMCIELSFYENLPLTRIASLLGVTLSRVSQIRNEALGKLAAYLKKFQ